MPARSFLPAALALAACAGQVEPYDDSGPLYFEVEFTGAVEGLDADSPAPYSGEARIYEVRIRAIGHDREPMDWDGAVAVHASPGIRESGPLIPVTGGEATTPIRVAKAFDALRIWVSDEDGSFATGVAPTVYVQKPTVADLQRPEGFADDASPLVQQYVPIRAFADPDPRELIVTTVTNDGFYVTDRSDEPGGFNSLFVFTFSRPDGVEPGARLDALAGIVSEFIGYTELQFPTYDVESLGHDPGAPVPLDPAIVCDDLVMEGYEATVVRVEDLVSDFRVASDCADYLQYGQWPALLPGQCGGGDARITVVNVNTVPSFRFDECLENSQPAPVELDWLVGVLRHTAPADPPWIVEVRDCLDFPPEHRPADCPGLLERPTSGPRHDPHHYYRDLASCSGVPYDLHR